jgi:hypothetical protein
MNSKNLISVITVIAVTLSFFAGVSFASSLGKIHFVKIAPQDAKAVIKGADGKLKLVKCGDVLNDNLKIVQIVDGEVVLEHPGKYGQEKIFVRIENGRQKIDLMEIRPLTQTRIPANKKQPKQ